MTKQHSLDLYLQTIQNAMTMMYIEKRVNKY